MIRRALIAISMTTLAACAAGCSGAPPIDLDGRDFVSVDITQDGQTRPLVPGTRIRLSFADGQLGATAGCNHLGGEYGIEGGRLLIGQMGMTEMGCDDARHAQDEWLAQLLGSRPQVRLDAANLVLESGATRVALLDVEVAEPDQALVGPVWVVESLVRGDAMSSVPAGVVASLQFAADGTVTVRGGCNQGGGQFGVEEGAIAFGPVAMTRMACPAPESEVESVVLAVLGAGRVDYQIDGQALRLRAGDFGLDLRPIAERDAG